MHDSLMGLPINRQWFVKIEVPGKQFDCTWIMKYWNIQLKRSWPTLLVQPFHSKWLLVIKFTYVFDFSAKVFILNIMVKIGNKNISENEKQHILPYFTNYTVKHGRLAFGQFPKLLLFHLGEFVFIFQ